MIRCELLPCAFDEEDLTQVAGRRSLFAGFVVGALVLLLVGAYLYDQSRKDVVATGVKVAGVDLGGLSSDAAFTRLQSRLDAPLQHPLVVTAAGKRFTLTPSRAGLSIDTRALLGAAVRASRGGSFISRTVRGLTGGRVDREIPLQVGYSHGAVRSLVASVAKAADRPARDASVKPGAGGLLTAAGEQPGVAVNAALLGARIERALVDPAAGHLIAAPLHPLRPHVTRAQIASKYPAYIVIDRKNYQLRFFQHLKLADSYPISVGRQGLETPGGLYNIQWKEVNPSWHVPNSAWAGKLAGTTVPPGPADPIKARWMAFDGGAGIHGTDETSSIGHAVSHGCVRMQIPDVIALYPRVPVGTPVYVL
ncbi:MAG: L,D-transpeptidase family protein [Solirubrobacteraceae bacterium]